MRFDQFAPPVRNPPLPEKEESLQTSDLPQSSAPDNPGIAPRTGPVLPLLPSPASAESGEGPFLPENKTVVPPPEEMVPKSDLAEPPASPNPGGDRPARVPISPLLASNESSQEALTLEDKLLLPLLSKEKELLENFGPDHPQVIALRSQIEVVRSYVARQQAQSHTMRRAGPPAETPALQPLQGADNDGVQKINAASEAEVDSAPPAAAGPVGDSEPVAEESQASPAEELSSQTPGQSQSPAKPGAVGEREAASEADPVLCLEVSYNVWQVISIGAALPGRHAAPGIIRVARPRPLFGCISLTLSRPPAASSLEFCAEPIPAEHKGVIDVRMPYGEEGVRAGPAKEIAVPPVDLALPQTRSKGQAEKWRHDGKTKPWGRSERRGRLAGSANSFTPLVLPNNCLAKHAPSSPGYPGQSRRPNW